MKYSQLTQREQTLESLAVTYYKNGKPYLILVNKFTSDELANVEAYLMDNENFRPHPYRRDFQPDPGNALNAERINEIRMVSIGAIVSVRQYITPEYAAKAKAAKLLIKDAGAVGSQEMSIRRTNAGIAGTLATKVSNRERRREGSHIEMSIYEQAALLATCLTDEEAQYVIANW